MQLFAEHPLLLLVQSNLAPPQVKRLKKGLTDFQIKSQIFKAFTSQSHKRAPLYKEVPNVQKMEEFQWPVSFALVFNQWANSLCIFKEVECICIYVMFLTHLHLKVLTPNLSLTFKEKASKVAGSFLKFKVMVFQWVGFCFLFVFCFLVFFRFLRASKGWNGMKPGVNVGSIQVPKVIWYPYEQIWWLNSTQLSLWLKSNFHTHSLSLVHRVLQIQSSAHGLRVLKPPASLRQCHTSSRSSVQTSCQCFSISLCWANNGDAYNMHRLWDKRTHQARSRKRLPTILLPFCVAL